MLRLHLLMPDQVAEAATWAARNFRSEPDLSSRSPDANADGTACTITLS